MLQEFVQQIKDSTSRVAEGMHTAFPGTVVEFDKEKNIAKIQPQMLFRKPDDSTMLYPVITGVPVVIPQVLGQRATIAFPISEGDSGLVIISEHSLDYWMYEQETDTKLSFDLSDAIFIPGVFNKPNPVLTEACEDEAIIINVRDKGIIKVTEDRIKASVPDNADIEFESGQFKEKASEKITLDVPGVNATPTDSAASVTAEKKVTMTGAGADARIGDSMIDMNAASAYTLTAAGATVNLSGGNVSITAPGTLTLDAGGVTITLSGGTATINGDVKVSGNVTADGDVLSDSGDVSLSHHTHAGAHGETKEPTR